MRALQSMFYKILQKNNYSLRRVSHLEQPLPNKSLDLFYEFFRDIILKRQQLGIYNNEEDLVRLINIDETSLSCFHWNKRKWKKFNYNCINCKCYG